MRRGLFLALLAATVAAPLPALAQDGGRYHGGGRQQNREARQYQRQERQQEATPAPTPAPAEAEAPPARPQRQAVRGTPRQAPVTGQSSSGPWVGDPNDPARARYERLERENARNYGSRQQARDVVERQRREGRYQGRGGRDWRDGRDGRDGRGNWNQNGRQGNRQWNGGWRNDRRYDWRGYRDANRFVFHIEPYYAPYRGYGYNRFSIGMVLDQLFFGRNYWIADPWSYRLPMSPPGTQWVRYFNDVVLVDTYSGEVLDVIYDFFW